MVKRQTKLQRLVSDGAPTNRRRDVQSLFDDYTVYLRGECHLAENTVTAYTNDLRRFRLWMEESKPGPVAQLDVAQLSDYVAWLHDQQLSPPSVSRNLVAVRTFYRFLHLEGLVTENPADLLATQKQWQRVPGVLSPQQVQRFLTAPMRVDTYWQRDRAILETLYATGCRRHDLAGQIFQSQARDLADTTT
ncbi:MAG: site-specific integrase, partial [Planctomycetota bacterium]